MIAPTLSLAEAADRRWDVVVIGAGPAGSVAARELARWGLSVLLVDKTSFPRWKVCGCCLNSQALTILRQVGLGDLPNHCGAVPLRRIVFGSQRRQAPLPLLGGVVLSREALDTRLVQAAVQAGVSFLPEAVAFLGSSDESSRVVLIRQGGQICSASARLVLAANGLGSLLLADRAEKENIQRASWIGAGTIINQAPPFYALHTIFMACGRGGYVGLVRLEDGRLDVAAAFDPALVKQQHHPGAAATSILQNAGFPDLPALGHSGWRGTPPLTRHVHRLSRYRFFVLGDAAGYVQPFTGEGIAWALATAKAIAPLAVRGACHWHASLEREWTVLYRQTVAGRQGICRILAKALRYPALASAAIAFLAHCPTVAFPVVRRLHHARP